MIALIVLLTNWRPEAYPQGGPYIVAITVLVMNCYKSYLLYILEISTLTEHYAQMMLFLLVQLH